MTHISSAIVAHEGASTSRYLVCVHVYHLAFRRCVTTCIFCTGYLFSQVRDVRTYLEVRERARFGLLGPTRWYGPSTSELRAYIELFYAAVHMLVLDYSCSVHVSDEHQNKYKFSCSTRVQLKIRTAVPLEVQLCIVW